MSQQRNCGLKPEQQGTLDALCGVYAVINAIRVALSPRRLSKRDTEDLYRFLLKRPHPGNYLSDLIFFGASIAQIGQLLTVSDQWLRAKKNVGVSYRKPFHVKKSARVSELIRSLEAHVEDAQSSAILLYEHSDGYHWTVAKHISPKRIHLADSGGMKALPRAATDWVNSSRLVRLTPTGIFLVRTVALS